MKYLNEDIEFAQQLLSQQEQAGEWMDDPDHAELLNPPGPAAPSAQRA